MLVAASLPDSCGNRLAANEIQVMCSRRVVSPDGRWQLVFKSDSEAAPEVHLDHRLQDDQAAIADRSGRVIATFAMERGALLYWLSDKRTLIVNYYAGSGSTRPYVVRLGHVHTKSIDLSTLVFPDVLRQIHKRPRQVYHYYVRFIADQGRQITLAAEPEYVLKGDVGRGDGRCLIYNVNKDTFLTYHFVREVPEDQCPRPSDEH